MPHTITAQLDELGVQADELELAGWTLAATAVRDWINRKRGLLVCDRVSVTVEIPSEGVLQFDAIVTENVWSMDHLRQHMHLTTVNPVNLVRRSHFQTTG